MISRTLVEDRRSSILPSFEALDALQLGAPWRVQTVNLHHLALARTDTRFAKALKDATWITADGWPVVALFRSAGVDCDRVTGSGWLRSSLNNDRLNTLRIGLLGGSSTAGDLLQARLGRALVFREHGHRASWIAQELLEQIQASDVQVLLVAVTPPYGDSIADELVNTGLRASVIAVGGGLDMAVGIQPSAPSWMARSGLEWLFRLLSAPRRLGRRYLLECIPFLVSDLAPAALRYTFLRLREHHSAGDGR